ncbi:MAG: AIM24 family protein [Desulfurivibrionaceae bacterium]|nr:AIM24 family protein [Desulfurivibrionaceae bacterium]
MQLYCPHCGVQRPVVDKDGGKKITCLSCGKHIPRPTAGGDGAAPPEQEDSSLAQFVKEIRAPEPGQGQSFFELEGDRLLRITLRGLVWLKRGSMVSWDGDIILARPSILGHGIYKFIKKVLSGQWFFLVRAEGAGRLFLADAGKQISILKLNQEAVFVNGNDLLAFEDSITWDIKMRNQGSNVMASGLFCVKLEGRGLVAVTTPYEPLTLKVPRARPILSDPNATAAWFHSSGGALKRGILPEQRRGHKKTTKVSLPGGF